MPPYWAVQALLAEGSGVFWTVWVVGMCVHVAGLIGLMAWWRKQEGSW
ncbi:hypothetical protein [Desmospora profundinema]|uniref:Uncharacterized protein n=1 Tax=Desmospora profundinema TaxID=1571184 RepID=A0ABU1ITE0_9BACL|nr:hypothetical protein [Desmospora profundinema]MDR6227189.1 hypothetical protein [Desmospora profundinema]